MASVTPLKRKKKGKVLPIEELIGEESVPKDIEAEMAVLGYILTGGARTFLEVMEKLNPDDFYDIRHRVIINCCDEMLKKDEEISLPSVVEFLKAQGSLDIAGGASHLAACVDASVDMTQKSSDLYVRVLKRKSALRKLLQIAGSTLVDIKSADFSSSEEVENVIDRVHRSIVDLMENAWESSSSTVTAGEVAREVTEKIEKYVKEGVEITGVETPFADLNAKLGGFQPSDLIILAARPSMGKTSLALNLALHAAETGCPVAFFSLEMSKEQLVNRILATMTEISAERIRRADLTHEEVEAIKAARDRLAELPIYLQDTPGITCFQLWAAAERLRRQKDIGLVIVDYLQLMSGGKKRFESREKEVAEISRNLKLCAKKLNIPVLALSQLSRRVEYREDKRPRLSDLRDSGAIEQDADVVLFLHREGVYSKGDVPPSKADLIVAKHRNGPTGVVDLEFDTETMIFVDVSFDVEDSEVPGQGDNGVDLIP